MKILLRLQNRIKREVVLFRNQVKIHNIFRQIAIESIDEDDPPVLFFNASTRLSGISQNAGFSLISSLGLRAAGIPVRYLVCKEGLTRCVLGTNRDDPTQLPPCSECWRTSRKIFPDNLRITFTYDAEKFSEQIHHFSLDEILNFIYEELPVGEIILPSLRWILRRYHLTDDEKTRYLAREYALSAIQLRTKIEKILDEIYPRSIVVFNGLFYPEAVVRWVGRRKGIPVVSHEVGMLPYSAFFTEGEATAYPVDIDDNFDLNERQNERLNEYLELRKSGDFITAGIKFWPEMKELDESYLKDISQFKWMVPIFTNVIFDTSQGHANVVFNDMFEWLDSLIKEIRYHKDILFIIRSHPDELREGKQSLETVAKWVNEKEIDKLPNVRFISANRFISSYDLIERSKFVMVYNSTIGLEASLMEKPVLCAGKARYTQIPTVFYPHSRQMYEKMLNDFLTQDTIEQPLDHIRNSRRMLYCQLFGVSLPFDAFLADDGVWKGYVQLTGFDISFLSPEKSPTMKVVLDGILKNQPFTMIP